MSEVQRICPQCAAAGPLSARYCARCGHDFQGELPAPQSSLPVMLGRAAVPVLVGAASVALRIGWKVLQSRWAQEAAERAVDAAMRKAQQAPAAAAAMRRPPSSRTLWNRVRGAPSRSARRGPWATPTACGVRASASIASTSTSKRRSYLHRPQGSADDDQQDLRSGFCGLHRLLVHAFTWRLVYRRSVSVMSTSIVLPSRQMVSVTVSPGLVLRCR